MVPGAHPAILGILSLLAKPGETVLCEAITYPGVRAIAAQLGIELVGLPMDRDGIDPRRHGSRLRDACPQGDLPQPDTAEPDHADDPRGAPRRHRRGRAPLQAADRRGRRLRLHPRATASIRLAAMAPDLTWHIAGLAKCIGAGLRAAYVVVPDAKSGWPFAAALRAANVMASPFTVALATRWIEDGTADMILRFIRAETAARQKMVAGDPARRQLPRGSVELQPVGAAAAIRGRARPLSVTCARPASASSPATRSWSPASRARRSASASAARSRASACAARWNSWRTRSREEPALASSYL